MRSWSPAANAVRAASDSGFDVAQEVAARALDPAHRVDAARPADRDRVGRPGGGEGHPRTDLEDGAVAETAGVAEVLRLEGLGQQPVEDAELLWPEVAVRVDVEAELALDTGGAVAEDPAGGFEQSVAGGGGERRRAVAADQRHGEVVSGMRAAPVAPHASASSLDPVPVSESDPVQCPSRTRVHARRSDKLALASDPFGGKVFDGDGTETETGETMTTYRDAGVDIDAQDRALAQVKEMVRKTYTPEVLSDQGAFGGLFRVPLKGLKEPVLVSSADGVGTKLKVAFATGRHSTVGQDLVNHCVNDILVQGARPLFFLDYLATGRLDPEIVADVIGGVAAACSEQRMALLGGETAEMPGFYADGEYDLAGFIVGVVDRKRILDGRRVQDGDVLVGLPSTGLHTNGYSLARKVFFETLKLGVGDTGEEPGPHGGGRAVAGPPLLPRTGVAAARGGLGPRPGPHHRRRAHRQSPARPARRPAGGHQGRRVGHSSRLPAAGARRDRCPRTTCGAPSTSGSAWSWWCRRSSSKRSCESLRDPAVRASPWATSSRASAGSSTTIRPTATRAA